MNIISKNVDFFFIKFPIIFPLIYWFGINFFPDYENYIIILTIFLLAEPHFGATWPFMLYENNKELIFKEKKLFFYLPVVIVLFSIIGFFYFKKEFLLIFFLANIFHVTRQSVGISKLYVPNLNEKKFQENLIYFFNILLFFVGFFRFYIPLIHSNDVFYLNIFLFIILFIICVIYIYKFKLGENIYTLITGLLIFFPIAFVDKPVHAILMGVTMHYSQYLILTYVINRRRNISTTKKSSPTVFIPVKKFFFIIFLYSLFMSIMSLTSKSSFLFLQQLVLVPIIFQNLHFYFDGLLWRFSKKENRINTLSFLYKHN
jgi:hypothetical protein